ncbi:MAG TPA: serine hydrolase domain-containing protein [Pseudonocardiaceae bacterium]|nr:serine hydrolase domain-containing protein [Pseudonocardiaceae bacterium]
MLTLLGLTPLVAGIAVEATAIAAPTPLPPTPPSQDLLPGGPFDRLIAQLAAQDQFSGTVLLSRHGVPVLARSYGMADRQRGVPNGPDTIYALASDGKPFTGVAVTQLAQQGKIEFGAPLGTYLDGFPAAIAGTVTVHHLLTHTSGMGDYLGSAAWQTQAPEFTSAAQEFDAGLDIVRAEPLLFAPGSSYSYSNSGYFTLGAIVARVSGLSYYDYVRRNVFGRAGMTSAGFYPKPRREADPRFAHPYATQPGGQRVDVSANEPFVGTPSGDACASAPDLVAFGHALVGAHLLNPAYTALMTGAKVPSPVGPFQAYGILNAIVNNTTVLLHGGGSPGETTNISIYPDLGWVAVVLCNYDVDLRPILRLQDQLITSSRAGAEGG